MTSVYDCVLSALIQMQKRTAWDDEVTEAAERLIKAVKDDQNIDAANDELADKIGGAMNEQFELGFRFGIHLIVQALSPVDLHMG